MNYSIIFKGSSGKVRRIKDYTGTLEKEFQVQYSSRQTFSNATGPLVPENLEMIIRVGETLFDFIQVYVYKKGYDLFLKETLFNPIYSWLESLSSFDDAMLPNELEFKFEDIKIKVGYSKRNHQNIVGQIVLTLIKISETIQREDLGELTEIATPVRLENDNEWRLYTPESNFEMGDFLKIWGLEYNSSNRCVIELPYKNFIFKHWWG